MEKRYQEYLAGFGLAYERPMSYEDFVTYVTKKDAEAKRQADEAANYEEEARAAYASYIRAAEEDDRFEVVRRMHSYHDDICSRLYAAGDKAKLKAYSEAYKEARRTILPPKKRRPCVISATQVYDDDDRPTTHGITL